MSNKMGNQQTKHKYDICLDCLGDGVVDVLEGQGYSDGVWGKTICTTCFGTGQEKLIDELEEDDNDDWN